MSLTTKKWLIKILASILLLIGFVTVEAFYFGPRRMRVHYQTISHAQIPDAFHEFSIAFFSDTHYLAFQNNDQLHRLIETVNQLQPDVIMFAGDLIDHPANNPINQEQTTTLIETLSQLSAPYGKYAVYGNHDLEGFDTREETSQILTSAGFRVLNNQNIKIHKDNHYVQLIGVDSQMLGSPDLPQAFEGVLVSEFAVLMSHTPDIANEINTKLTDVVLSGHTHGHQVYIPFISQFFLPPYGTMYHKGMYQIDDETTLYITNGVGTTVSSARFFANPEVMFFRLKAN